MVKAAGAPCTGPAPGRRWRARVLASPRGGMAPDARPALLGARNHQRPTNCRRASNRKPSGRCRKSGWPRPRRMRLRPSTPSSRPWGVKYDKAVERLIKDCDAAARLLRLPGQALEAPAHDERHRKLVRHGAPPHGTLPGMSPKQDRVSHDLQARRGCRKKLASPRWPQPVAENHPRYKVHRRNSRLSDRKLKSLPPDPFHHQDLAIAR